MKSFLLLVFSFVAVQAAAQKIRFTDTSNRWKIEQTVGMIGEQMQELAIMKLGADTIINGLSYKKPEILYYSFCQEWPNGGVSCGGGPAGPFIYGGYYREDTAAGRVYCFSAFSNDPTEHIIYDAGWRIGDTVDCFFKCKVVGYDSAFLYNNWHKVFVLTHLPNGWDRFQIVEGIGCLKGPAFPVHAPPPGEAGQWLRCFERAGDRPAFALSSGFYTGLNTDWSCNTAPLGVSEIFESTRLKVIPNPGDKTIIFQLGESPRSGKLCLADASGKLIASLEIQEKREIPIGGFLSTPGLYFYAFQDASSGQRYTGSFTFR